MSDMNTLDIIILLLLGFTLVRGLFRGFVGEISSIVGLVAGFILANRYHDQLLPLVSSILPDPDLANLISYVLIFITGLILVLMVAAVLRHLLRIALLGWVDRFAGATIGILKGSLVCVLLVLLLTTFLTPQADVLKNSRLAPYVIKFSTLLADLMPDKIRQGFVEKSQPLHEQWMKNIQ